MPQQPNDILHYYRLASQQAALAQTPEEEAAAYRQGVNFCEDSRVCRLDDSIKRNSVMFWSYNNIGDALLKKGRSLLGFKAASKNYAEVLHSYDQALHSARDAAEKISTLNKMAQTYRLMGDKENWIKTEEKVIENLADSFKRPAYLKLAEQADDLSLAAALTEKALDYVLAETVSLRQKFRNLLDICSRLEKLYRRLKDGRNRTRLLELKRKTVRLLMSALENKIIRETDSRRKYVLYDELMRLGNHYLEDDRLWKVQILQLLKSELAEGEVWHLDGTKYSRKIIDKMLRKI